VPGWLKTEWLEVDVTLSRDICPEQRRGGPVRVEVRAVVVAEKPAKADGAKDGRKVNLERKHT